MEFDDSALVVRRDNARLATNADKRWMTLHCQKCKTILGDGLGVCGEIKSLGFIICLKVTKDVVVSEKKEVGHRGEMAHSIYSTLSCRCCRTFIGRVIYSTIPRLAVSRSMYLLHKPHISCYILNSCSMMKATSVSFNVKPLLEKMNEMKQKFEVQSKQVTILQNKMEDKPAPKGRRKQGAGSSDKRPNM